MQLQIFTSKRIGMLSNAYFVINGQVFRHDDGLFFAKND